MQPDTSEIMYAKNLENLLANFMSGSDVSATDHADMSTRFDSLRSYGRLPRGRERREQLLTVEQVANALLCLASSRPGWAGLATIVLSLLKPVGGPDASFCGTANLREAVKLMLKDGPSRQSMTSLMVSTAEGGMNSNGYAEITYELKGDQKRAWYVPKEAVSLLQPGAEKAYMSERRHASISRELRFNRAIFDRLAREIELALAYSIDVAGDGSEYDAEEDEQRRRERLGVTRRSRFINIGVDNQVTWPQKEMLVKFDKYTLVLMPKTKDKVQSVHIDLTANKLTDEEAMTVINRFLSVMTWCDDHFAIAQGGWSGNPIPVAVSRRDLAFTTATPWVLDRRLPATDEARRALALYREARNAEENFLVSYAVLNYFKIIEIRHQGRGPAKNWFRDNFVVLESERLDDGRLNAFRESCGQQAVHEYIYGACRLAVAHASEKAISDPDEASEISRLHNVADILRRLARHFIKNELGISDSKFGA